MSIMFPPNFFTITTVLKEATIIKPHGETSLFISLTVPTAGNVHIHTYICHSVQATREHIAQHKGTIECLWDRSHCRSMARFWQWFDFGKRFHGNVIFNLEVAFVFSLQIYKVFIALTKLFMSNLTFVSVLKWSYIDSKNHCQNRATHICQICVIFIVNVWPLLCPT